MKVLLTSASTRLSQELAQALSVRHELVLTDRKQLSTRLRFVACDLNYDDACRSLVEGMDAIVHSGEVDAEASVSVQLDAAARCTYNLLWAASEAGVPRFIYLSSLSVMEKYPWELAVTEMWKPAPGLNPPTLCYHLGEYVCREFAREGKIEVACLRMGDIAWTERSVNSSSLYVEDAVQAVEKALAADFGPGAVGARYAGPPAPGSMWNLLHIQSDVPRARYLTTAAQNALGYTPTRRE